VKQLAAACSLFARLIIPLPTTAAQQDTEPPVGFTDPVDIRAWVEMYGVDEGIAKAQIDARADLDKTAEAVAREPEKYTGFYVTHENGEFFFHIVVKEGQQPDLAVPRSDAVHITYETQPVSRADLDRLFVELTTNLLDRDLYWTHLGYDAEHGQLVGSFPADEATEIARQVLGEHGEVTKSDGLYAPTACNEYDDCTPFRGGIRLYPQDNTGFICSIGFIAKGIGTGKERPITAGHCGSEANWVHGLNASGVWVGQTAAIEQSVWGDLQKISRSTWQAQPRDSIMYSWQQTNYDVDSVKVKSTIGRNDNVNMTGQTSGTKVTTVAFSPDSWCLNDVNGQTFCVMDGASAAAQMQPGDSGGPAYYNGDAMGIVSVAGGGITLWTYADNIDNLLDAAICLTDAC